LRSMCWSFFSGTWILRRGLGSMLRQRGSCSGRAREELERGGVRQAAEKLWGAAALAVKAYAAWRDGKRLASNGELWEYTRRMMAELGGWVSDAWAQANAMHVCFYEGWCTREHVEQALERIKRLVENVASRIRT